MTNQKMLDAFQLSTYGPHAQRLLDQLYLLDIRGLDESALQRLYTNANKAQALRDESELQSRAKLQAHGVIELIEAIAHARGEAIRPVYGDLLSLYEWVRARKPNLIIEYGSGWSTYVIASALEQVGHGRLLSIEAQKSWADLNTKYMPSQLRDVCEIRYSPVAVRQIGGHAVYVHAEVPPDCPDLIYVDGPSCSPPVVAASADALMYEERLKPGAEIIIDGRHSTVLFLQQQWRRSWTVQTLGIRGIDRTGAGIEVAVLQSKFSLMDEDAPAERDRAQQTPVGMSPLTP